MSTNNIFISYSHQDKAFATRLASALAQKGLDVWLDVEDIPPGENWRNAIDEGLRTADVMLLLVSPQSMASQEVQAEWNDFLGVNKRVIPILLRETTMPSRLKVLQWLDFSQPEVSFEEKFAKLRRELAAQSTTTEPIKNAAEKSSMNQSSEPPNKKDEGGLNRTTLLTLIIVPVLVAIIGAAATIISSAMNNQPAPVVVPTTIPTVAATVNSVVSTQAASVTAAPTSTPPSGFDVTLIFNDQTSFILMTNSATNLAGMELRSTRQTVKLADGFPDLSLNNFVTQAGDCLIFLKTGDAPPPPRDCQKIYEDPVIERDIFWYDTVANRLRDLAFYVNGTQVGICSAATQTCDFKG